jgi:plastocyanin
MSHYRFAAAVAALSILFVAPGASSAPAAPSPAAPPAVASILISGFEYSGDLTVKPGQEVKVTNSDPVPVMHTLTDKATALFNTGPIASAGGTATFTAPAKPGSYPFGCLFHLFMAGTLVVQD